MTVSEMTNEVIRLTEYDSNEPNTTTALFFLNLAALDASRITKYLLNVHSFSVSANTIVVSEVSNLFVTIEEVWWNGQRIHHHEKAWLQSPPITAGVPSAYTLAANRIFLIPPPANAGTLLVRGAMYHPKMILSGQPGENETTICLFSPDLHHSLCKYAAGLWLEAYTPHQEQTQRATNLKQLALQHWQMLQQEVLESGIRTMRYTE
ncbi:MAG: hypothetical protein KatS3mg087_1753 [Patescibacteria group bacterium]|nr:MAG: hypothetical protein KatS3mg087_1753 [Patescibacteria group bacterium]